MKSLMPMVPAGVCNKEEADVADVANCLPDDVLVTTGIVDSFNEFVKDPPPPPVPPPPPPTLARSSATCEDLTCVLK